METNHVSSNHSVSNGVSESRDGEDIGEESVEYRLVNIGKLCSKETGEELKGDASRTVSFFFLLLVSQHRLTFVHIAPAMESPTEAAMN